MKFDIPLVADVDIDAEDADQLCEVVSIIVQQILWQRDPNCTVKLKPVRVVS